MPKIAVTKTPKSVKKPPISLPIEIKADISRVLMAVTNGIGVMPAYQGLLSDEEINAVATYVAESTN